jgi:hypothetical protein
MLGGGGMGDWPVCPAVPLGFVSGLAEVEGVRPRGVIPGWRRTAGSRRVPRASAVEVQVQPAAGVSQPGRHVDQLCADRAGGRAGVQQRSEAPRGAGEVEGVAASTSQAELDWNDPEGRWASGPCLRSAWTCSTIAWARWACSAWTRTSGLSVNTAVAVGSEQFLLLTGINRPAQQRCTSPQGPDDAGPVEPVVPPLQPRMNGRRDPGGWTRRQDRAPRRTASRVDAPPLLCQPNADLHRRGPRGPPARLGELAPHARVVRPSWSRHRRRP